MLLDESSPVIKGFFNNEIQDAQELIDKIITKCNSLNITHCFVEHENTCNSNLTSKHWHYCCIGTNDGNVNILQKYIYESVYKMYKNKNPKFFSSVRMDNYITKHANPVRKINNESLLEFLIYTKHNGPNTTIITNNNDINIYFNNITSDQTISSKKVQQEKKEIYEQDKVKELSCLKFKKGKNTYYLPHTFKAKLELDNELENFIKDANIINYNCLWKLNKEERQYVDLKFQKQTVYEHIEKHGHNMNIAGFKFTNSDSQEGLPFRWFNVASFVADDKKEGIIIKDYLDDPETHLEAGISLLWYTLMNNLTPEKASQFLIDLEIIMNKTADKKTVISITGPSNCGKTLVSSLVTQFVNTGLITKNGEASQFVFQDTVDKRVCHMEEAKITQNLEQDYLAFFSKNDPMQIQVKHQKPINLGERSNKPSFIITSNWSAYRDCVNIQAFKNRVIDYEFGSVLDTIKIQQIKDYYNYPNNIYITPFHYMCLVSSLNHNPNMTLPEIFEYIKENKFINTFNEIIEIGCIPLTKEDGSSIYEKYDEKLLLNGLLFNEIKRDVSSKRKTQIPDVFNINFKKREFEEENEDIQKLRKLIKMR